MTATMRHAQPYMFFYGFDRDSLQASDVCLAEMVNLMQDEYLLAAGRQRLNRLHQVVQCLTGTRMLFRSGRRAYLVFGPEVTLVVLASALVMAVAINRQMVQDAP